MAAHCSRCETPLAPEDIRCAVCALPVPIDLVQAPAAQAEILRCEECAAAVTYNVEARAPRCAFCGSVMHVETPADPIEEAEAYLPFTVSPAQARAALSKWLGTLGFFRPADLQSSAVIDKLEPLWWVGWVFDAKTLVSWTADSNAGARRSDWAPHAGQNPLTLRSILVPASRGLRAAECEALTSRFDLNSAQATPIGAADATIERFDVQRSAARVTIADAVQAAAAQHAEEWIPGSRFRNVHTVALLRRLETQRLAFPTYVLAYRYGDKLYRALVHGQNRKCVVASAPYSVVKIALAIVAGMTVLLLIVVIIGTR
jgi:hypothetical protein